MAIFKSYFYKFWHIFKNVSTNSFNKFVLINYGGNFKSYTRFKRMAIYTYFYGQNLNILIIYLL